MLTNISAQSIDVNGGNITMTIRNGTPGGQLINVISTTTSLSYHSQKYFSKITVKTVCLGQQFNLDVIATNVSAGVAAPSVALLNANPAIDFITYIPKAGSNDATCILQYTASATFSQGNSNEFTDDVHTVTFTIQSQ